ncbi:MAG: DUF4292 domain-containing protein [Bacteroidia bacterium]|nr:DUF4292 domain-containing protein [Bacteroidia bacterium]NNF31547.1 DUF4292 domain-containing protein [Flavobacteriaceae bacterium]MBT8275622.1 DUF4292 domain-containing protein [Bacteroidia bacterium]NNJ82377.1 DUF4292 domain-containing protein [Flavobacteriaceae bacterium]NNK54126.1 DUF4292 domain-containing protein [Flavobacteriaceae bacterium]
MKRVIIYLFALLLLLTSCKGLKGVNGSETANAGLQAKEIIATHKLASPKFNTMAGRIKVEYEDEKKSQSITVSLRMEKDKKIWIKASIIGITLAKVMITPDSVSYYETLSNSYFDGDFTLISEWLGTEVDFEKTQAILLGQTMFELNKSTYTSQVVNNQYKLLPKQQLENFIHSLFLNPSNFKVASVSVAQPWEDRMLTVYYGPYQMIEGGYFPSELSINTIEGDDRTRIDVTYRKIDLNVDVNFPFNIPRGYEQIDLGR